MNNLIFVLTCLLLVMLFVVLLYTLSFSFFLFYSSNSSPFECGFSPMISSVIFFSMPFFLISIIFLLFDVEILVLCFYPLHSIINSGSCITILFCILVILFSTLYEWLVGIIGWI